MPLVWKLMEPLELLSHGQLKSHFPIIKKNGVLLGLRNTWNWGKRRGASSSHLGKRHTWSLGRGKIFFKKSREETIEREGERATKCNSGRKCFVVLALRRISLCKRPEQGKAQPDNSRSSSKTQSAIHTKK